MKRSIDYASNIWEYIHTSCVAWYCAVVDVDSCARAAHESLNINMNSKQLTQTQKHKLHKLWEIVKWWIDCSIVDTIVI